MLQFSSAFSIVGHFCNTSSVGLPHSTGRAHLIRGTIIYSYNDGKGVSGCSLTEAASNRQFIRHIVSLTLSSSSTQLQDREVLVSLLVGAKYGMSQVINHKLNVISTLVEFSSISRVELLSESDKVSLLRISLHDMKVWMVLGP